MRLLPILLYFLSFLLSQSFSDAQLLYSCPNNSSNSASDEFTNNRIRLFNRLLYDETVNSIYNITTEGQDPDKVYGLYLCRAVVTTQTCYNCIVLAIITVNKECNGTKEAIIWYDDCLVSYSNTSLFSSTLKTTPNFCMWNTENITEPAERFNNFLAESFSNITANATSSDSKYADRTVSISSSSSLSTVAQCIPDLSNLDCKDCLDSAAGGISVCSEGKKDGRIFLPSCNMRYELHDSDQVSVSNTTGGIKRGKIRKAVGTAVGTSISAMIILLLGYIFWRRKSRTDKDEKANNQEIGLLRLRQVKIGKDSSYDTLRGEKQEEHEDFPLFPLRLTLEATQHFSQQNKLGEGGFGPVYKGTLADGKEIAVKRLSRTSGQGLQEFKNEVILIAKLQHKNLVRLLGCCLEENESLLIYEFMPNKSLDILLFDSTKSVQLDWKIRLNIINGIARGLLYLHEDSRLKIIHRDLKASNVLLDLDMNPKISDFGMARIFGGNQSEANTNRVVGTYGYMAPEYAMEGVFSVKSDVFSFGVLLLEIVSGKKNSGFYLSEQGQSLLAYTWKLWCEGNAERLIDPVLKQQSYFPAEILKCIHIGLLCVQEDSADRPTMSSIAVMLATDTITLPQPTQPAFSIGRLVAREAQSSVDNGDCSANDVTLSNVSPR